MRLAHPPLAPPVSGGVARLNPKHPLAPWAWLVIDPLRSRLSQGTSSIVRDAIGAGVSSGSTNAVFEVAPEGYRFRGTIGSSSIIPSSRPSIATSAARSMFMLVAPRSLATSRQMAFASGSTGMSGIQFGDGTNSTISGFAYTTSQQNVTGPTFNAGQLYAVGHSCTPGASGSQLLWVDGTEYTGSLSANLNAASPRLNLNANALEVYGFAMFSRALSGAEFEALARSGTAGSLSNLIQWPRNRRMWMAAAAGSDTTLAIADLAHAHAADAPVLTQDHLLALADLAHAHAADNVTLSAGVTLAVADLLHTHAADAVGLTQDHLLAVADLLHAHAADGVTLIAGDSLLIADLTHGHGLDTLALAQVHSLTISSLAHAQLLGAITFPGSGITTPGARTLIVLAEDRVYVIAAENRTLIVH